MTRRILAALGLVVVGLVIAVVTGWGALVLFYLAPGPELVRKILAWGFAALGLGAVVALAVRRLRRPAFAAYAVALVLVVVAWNSPSPSNDRDWQPDVAVLPHATINGDLVTVHNIRNFDYRTETDFTPAYYDRTFDLRKLDRVDLFAVYWMGPAIAHIFLSFGFGDQHLPISIEVRKTRSKEYSTIPGFFRQYELIYIVADERDVVRVRTNYRKIAGGRGVHVPGGGRSDRERPPHLPGLHTGYQQAERASALLQHADDQLHHRDLRPLDRESRPRPLVVEDPRQRLRAGVRCTSWDASTGTSPSRS